MRPVYRADAHGAVRRLAGALLCARQYRPAGCAAAGPGRSEWRRPAVPGPRVAGQRWADLSHAPPFLRQCNRIRVLANGNLKPCLHAAAEYPLRGLPPEALRAAIAQAILQKPQQHTMDAHHASRSCRNMHEIGG